MITVLGASGFIGSHVVRRLQRDGTPVDSPARDEPLAGRDLGHVVYCIGLTADFRERPHDAAEAHVGALLDVIRHCTFDSLLYVSSTRVYHHSGDGIAREEDDLQVNPLRADDLYNLSKLLGESVVLGLPAGKGRVARLSNVYGAGQADTFLTMVLDEAQQHGTVALRSGLQCTRDFISVADVAGLLVQIAMHGKQRIYNVASGTGVSTDELIAVIGCGVSVAPDAPTSSPPAIDIGRIRAEFGFVPARLVDELPSLLGPGA